MKNFKQTKGEYKELHTPITRFNNYQDFAAFIPSTAFFCLRILKKILFISYRPLVSKREHALDRVFHFLIFAFYSKKLSAESTSLQILWSCIKCHPSQKVTVLWNRSRNRG